MEQIVQHVLSPFTPEGEEGLPPGPVLSKAVGKDIVKKSSNRQNRYLLVFNGLIEPATAGKLGTLSALDTKNPVMDIDFPTGHLRLSGTLVFPRNKYMMLNLAGRAAVQCEDVFDSMIVFGRATWVEAGGESAGEGATAGASIPGSVVQHRLHEGVQWGARAVEAARGGAARAAINRSVTPQTSEEEEEEEEEVGSDGGAAPHQPKGTPSRRAATRGVSYKEGPAVSGSDSEEAPEEVTSVSDPESASSFGDDAPLKRGKKKEGERASPSQTKPAARTAVRKRSAAEGPGEGPVRTRKAPKSSTSKRSVASASETPTPSAKRGIGVGTSGGAQPTRRARAATKASYCVDSGSSEEEADTNSSGSDGEAESDSDSD